MKALNLREKYEIIETLAPLATVDDWKEICFEMDTFPNAVYQLVWVLNRRIPKELARAWPLAPSILKEMLSCA